MKEELVQRQKSEAKFHNEKIKHIKHRQCLGDFYSLEDVSLAHKSLLRAAGDFRDKNILDYGCGVGWASLNYAMGGARQVVGMDISNVSLQLAREKVMKTDSTLPIHFTLMAGESLGLKSGSFDMVLGDSILHHTDLFFSMPEIYRVLKKGGIAIFVNPLNHNPIISFFRRLTPWRRSLYEKPLNMDIISSFHSLFRSVQIEGYYLTAVFALGAYLFHRSPFLLKSSLRILADLDSALLHTFPKLHRHCFASVIVLRK